MCATRSVTAITGLCAKFEPNPFRSNESLASFLLPTNFEHSPQFSAH